MSQPTTVTRLVYPGAPVIGAARITAVKIVKAPDDTALDTVHVPNLAHYESGCREHAACWGHYCKTPNGILLPPQSMSMRTGEITTEYLKAAKFAFEGRKNDYMNSLEKTNFTKEGTMRSIMHTPVAGSGRLIATPMWYRRNNVWVSSNLAQKLKTCYIHIDDSGVMDPVYKERELQEDDWVILVRPPPLNIWNTQPMRIKFWEHHCIGVHPETFTMFHGDYDGDEAHIIPVYHPESIAECEAWNIPANDKFEYGRMKYAEDNPGVVLDENYWHRCEFMNTTTVSSSQMKQSAARATYGNISRNKDTNLLAMHNRFNDQSTERDFVQQSIRGMKDVCKQQLSQGLIGDMTRVAKMAAMCFIRPSTGSLYAFTDNGPVLLCDDKLLDQGNPAERAVMSLCEISQQAALDSHRVQESDMTSHDFISDILLCSPVLEQKGPQLPTIVVLSAQTPAGILSQLAPKYKHLSGDFILLLCPIQKIPKDAREYVKGSYNPVVLSSVTDVLSDTQKLCYIGISVVCNYYNISLTQLEITDLSYMFSFRVHRSKYPITTRNGLISRNLPWIETMEATDVTKLQQMKTNWQIPFSSTSSMFMSNFSRMVLNDVI